MELKKIGIAILLLQVIILFGVLGYMFTEELNFFEALWLTVVSILTIGYGDLFPVSTSGKLLTVFLIPLAIGLTTYMLAQLAGAVISGKLSNEMRRRRMNRKIDSLRDHVIICGYGRVGQQVLQQLLKENQSIVVIEKNRDVIDTLPSEVLFVEGNATEDTVLMEAGVKQAKGVVVALPNDADNVFITLTVKGLRPSIHTVVRAERKFSEEKLFRAGADKVINTSSIGGKRMAMAMIKPISVEYVDTIFHDKSNDYNIEEILLKPTSILINKSIVDSEIKEKFGVNIVAIKRDGKIMNNPPAKEKLKEDDLLILFGTAQQIKRFEKISV